MKKSLQKIPLVLRSLFKKLLIPFVFLTVTRIIFYAFNFEKFEHVSFFDFLAGAWFDCVTISLYFLPFIVLFLFPLPVLGYKSYKFLLKFLFVVTTMLLIAMNLMDVEYFNYTSKRSTMDLFTILGAGSDFKQLVTTFITDFWYLILMFILAFVLIWKWFSKIEEPNETFPTKPKNFYKSRSLIFILSLGFFILIGRGGFGFRPIGILEAANFTKPSNTALVLNTPFTMLKSYGQSAIEEANYFKTLKETERYFNPAQKSVPQHILPDSSNVVILILESFGEEFIGFYNPKLKQSYTPFLDSILTKSLTFTGSFANGKKSIEAVPSIFASIPSLMDSPYISSPYNANRIIGLPELLKQFGYESAFYHGATNGSMRFDAFAKFIGFDHYFGKKEYNNEAHSDKTWGILDEYFEPWSARKMSELKEPFLASIFTLSSHHPYFIPKHMRDKVIRGPQPICASINYGDYSLRKFFEEAKKQDWYDNTVFVIVADHTPASNSPFYNQRTQLFQVPIAFYHPGGKIKPEKRKGIVKQLDIYPTILDILNIETKFYSYGTSVCQINDNQSFTFLEGVYYYYKNNRMLTFSDNKARNLYDFTHRSTSMVDSLSYLKQDVRRYETTLKAIIQRYNHDLLRNQTVHE
jgi:phosphoglycerol transferase MdoB-like AlkP superfamily enzyme